jgi:hydroxymethylbilane synthase
MQQLLSGLPRMLLPLTMCPAAPAQGALAIECRDNDERTRQLLAAVEHTPTRMAVAAEREMLAARGGGCHQQFGATQLNVEGLGGLLRWREAEDVAPQSQAQLQWSPATPLPAPGRVAGHWDGSASPAAEPAQIGGMTQRCAESLAAAPSAFIAHRHALPRFDEALSAEHVNRCRHIWVPGTATWFALAQRGIWVEGCAEGLGFDSLESTLTAPLLQLPASHVWLVLTHEAAASGWHDANVLTTYRSRAAQGAAPQDASHVFWHSAAQFEHWRESLSPGVHHACAFGKTAAHLRRAGVDTLTVFPSALEWRQWLIS